MKSSVSLTYDPDIGSAIKSAFEHLQDLEEVFRGKQVAIKPNDTWASPRDLTPCTQADTLRAVIRRVKEYHPKSIVVSGGAGAAETGDIFRYLGLDTVIEEEGVEFFDHNRPPFVAVPLEYGPQREVMVNQRVLEYETLVSLAQLKVHDSATVTLTMKNIALSYPAADYYGHPRSRRMHHHSIFKDLHTFIAGMCRRFPIHLGIIAGHPAMIGEGPIGGKTFETGLVIASRDCVAADAAGAKLLGAGRVQHIEDAEKLGVGTADLHSIRFMGMPLEEAVHTFREKAKSAAAYA